MNKISLSYADERDKTYGITGMTITLVVCDAEDYLSEIHLDNEPGECMVMAHQFGFKGNPRMSAKIVWEQTLNDLRVTTSMALGNIMCRRYILGQKPLSNDETSELRRAVMDEASEHCALDDDESSRLFDACYHTVDRIFRHSAVRPIADSFASQLADRRTLSANEAIEILAHLGIR